MIEFEYSRLKSGGVHIQLFRACILAASVVGRELEHKYEYPFFPLLLNSCYVFPLNIYLVLSQQLDCYGHDGAGGCAQGEHNKKGEISVVFSLLFGIFV